MEKLSAFKSETNNCFVKEEQVAFGSPDRSLLQIAQKPVGLQQSCYRAESVFKSKFQPKKEDLLIKEQVVVKKSLCKMEVKSLDLEDLLND